MFRRTIRVFGGVAVVAAVKWGYCLGRWWFLWRMDRGQEWRVGLMLLE